MNRVINAAGEPAITRYSMHELTGANVRIEKTAFIGYIEGSGVSGTSLYLISYSGIIKADEPWHTWTVDFAGSGTVVVVVRFVDVEIRAVERGVG